MRTIQYISQDRSRWPGPEEDQPWHGEPDKIQWQDERTGLPCLAVRNQFGAWCGYVGVYRDHPWYGVDYGEGGFDNENRPEAVLRVHGGITFSSGCQKEATEAEGICHVAGHGEDDRVWWFGFDCAHYRDLVPTMQKALIDVGSSQLDGDSQYRDLDYVRSECASLAKQLESAKLTVRRVKFMAPRWFANLLRHAFA